MNKLLDKLEYKYGKFGINNLILYVIGTMLMIFIADLCFSDLNLTSMLSFDRSAILHGQIGRVITFLFIPDFQSLIGMIFSLLLFYMIGMSLERTWGAFKFTVYYFMGALLNIITGFLIGYTDNYYLNISLFLAYAVLYPNEKLYFYFLIPIKMKWIGITVGIVMSALFLFHLFFLNLASAFAIFAPLLNFILFFGGDFIDKVKNHYKYKPMRDQFRKNMREVERRRNDNDR